MMMNDDETIRPVTGTIAAGADVSCSKARVLAITLWNALRLAGLTI